MNPSPYVSEHFHQVLFGGNWTWTNLEELLSDVSYEEANHQIGKLNTILGLVHHISYYFGVQLKVLQGGPLKGSDKESWSAQDINSEERWELYVKETLNTGLELTKAIEAIPEEKWESYFSDEKYGSYYRNFHGMIEHTHYHLGQISLIKKMIRS